MLERIWPSCAGHARAAETDDGIAYRHCVTATGKKKARCGSGLNLFSWRKIEETDA